MPKAKVDKRALTEANGYVRGAHREEDSIRNKNKYTDASVELQDWVLAEYKKWVSEDNELDKDYCLPENQLALDLATVKDFICFLYILSKRNSHAMTSNDICTAFC